MNALYGINIVTVPVLIEPVLELSPNVNVSDAFRYEFDQWLRTTFGTRDVTTMPRGTAIKSDINNTLIMREDDYVAFQREAIKRGVWLT